MLVDSTAGVGLRYGQALRPAPAATHPVTESRWRVAGSGGEGGWIIIRIGSAAQLRLPLPARTPPGRWRERARRCWAAGEEKGRG